MTEVSQVAIDAVQFYRSKGISKDAAVAIVSVLWYESKLRPGSQGSQSTETPGTLNPGGAYGIASWNGPRQAVLAAFAQKKGLNVGDLNTQLAFVLTEMANSYHASWAAITSTQTYTQIIPIIVAEYENPKDHQAEINGAMAFAGPLYVVVSTLSQPIPPISQPIPQPTTGVITMPPLDPMLASIIESLLSGLVKAIIQHMTGIVPATTTTSATHITVPPAFDPAALAKTIATELSTLIPGVKL